MNTERMQSVLVRFQSKFRARFSALTEQDMQAILAAPREQLITVLGTRYGYSAAEAKAAWNEFVLRDVDGRVGKGTKLTGGANKPFQFMRRPPLIQRHALRDERPWLRNLPQM